MTGLVTGLITGLVNDYPTFSISDMWQEYTQRSLDLQHCGVSSVITGGSVIALGITHRDSNVILKSETYSKVTMSPVSYVWTYSVNACVRVRDVRACCEIDSGAVRASELIKEDKLSKCRV